MSELRRESGELSFEAQIGERAQRVWFRTAGEVMPTAEAALAACLMPAMSLGGSLSLPEPIDPRIMRTQREFQAIQRAWSLGWGFGDPQLEEIEVLAPTATPAQAGKTGRVAAFFSGGVDSWSTILDHDEITDLIFVRGIDLVPGEPRHEELAGEVEARLLAAAGKRGLPLHLVETNLRELSDPLIKWEPYYGCALVAVALFLAPLFDRVLIAGDSDHEVQVAMGANHLVNELWSTERLEIVEDGGRYSRAERVRRIADDPLVRETLRVCWENPGGSYNCGRCRKCLMTMITLEAYGALADVETFPAELDLDAVADVEISHPVLLTLWEDVLDTVRKAGRADLEPAAETVVVAGKRRLGLPAGYRRRQKPGPPPLIGKVEGEAGPRLDPDQEARAAEILADVLASRSWRLTAPLRALTERRARFRARLRTSSGPRRRRSRRRRPRR